MKKLSAGTEDGTKTGRAGTSSPGMTAVMTAVMPALTLLEQG